MAEEFHDNLPLGGEVRIKGDERIHTYRGFEGDNTRRCAVGFKGDPHIAWFQRSSITPVSNG